MIQVIKELQSAEQAQAQLQELRDQLDQEKAEMLRESEIQMNIVKEDYESRIEAHVKRE